MTDLRKAAEMALEALKNIRAWPETREALHQTQAIEALRQALAQTEQESVICRNIYEVWAGSDGVPIPETIVEAYLLRLIEQMRDEASKGLKALYTAPPKKEWVGLTEAEIIELAGGGITRDERMIAHAIEAWLKEKNT